MKRKTLAIPLRLTDYSDSTQIVSLFTRDVGLLEGIAKGAYREKNAFQGAFDIAVLREVVFVERRTQGLAIVTESSVLDGYRGLRGSWKRHVAASHVVELLRAVITQGDASPALFDLSHAVLRRLSDASEEAISDCLLHFELRALRLLGFLSPIDACAACSRPWPGEGRPAYFSPRSGGLLCRRCVRARPLPGGATTLPGPQVKILQRLAENTLMRENGRLERALSRRLHRLLFEGCIFFLECPFKMVKYSPAWL